MQGLSEVFSKLESNPKGGVIYYQTQEEVSCLLRLVKSKIRQKISKKLEIAIFNQKMVTIKICKVYQKVGKKLISKN